MARRIINIGSSVNKGDGDALRFAFDKVNDNFEELYARAENTDSQTLSLDGDILSISNGNEVDLSKYTDSTFSGSYNDLTDRPTLFDGNYSSLSNTPDLSQFISRSEFDSGTITIDVNNTGDLQGSVFADDSTLLVDAVNGTIPWSVISNVQVTESDLLVDWAAIVGLTIQNNGLPILPTQTLDISGSVFADDSTLLVDGVAGKIVGTIDTAQPARFTDSILIQNGNDLVSIGDEIGASFQLPNKGVSFLGGGVDGGNYNVGFTSNGSGSILTSNQFNIISGAGMAINTANGLAIFNTVTVNAAVTAPSFVGDVTGSVLLDDSTVVVDGTSGNITGNIIQANDALNALGGLGVNGNSFFYGDITISDNGKIVSNGDAYFGQGISVPSISSSLVNSNNLNINAQQNVIITADTDGLTPRVWNFNTNGTTTFPGPIKLKEVYEEFNNLSNATGVVEHDLSTGHIFNHGLISANFTANFTNIDTTGFQATTVTLVLTQGGTAYLPTAVQIGGVGQTINWQGGGSGPTGTPNGIDVVTFSILSFGGGSYTVLGQLTDFG